jgi:hypothetical protein
LLSLSLFQEKTTEKERKREKIYKGRHVERGEDVSKGRYIAARLLHSSSTKPIFLIKKIK